MALTQDYLLSVILDYVSFRKIKTVYHRKGTP